MQVKRTICCVLASLLLTGMAEGQTSNMPVIKGRFPGLQLLPPGSELRGISIPRYEAHKVTSMLTADYMLVQTAYTIVLNGLKLYIYEKNGDTIEVSTSEANGNFAIEHISSPSDVVVTSPHLNAEGKGFKYSQASNEGIVKGPIRTAIRLTPGKKDTSAEKK